MATAAAIAQELRQVVGDLDPDAVPLAQAMSLWRRYDDIERLVASAKTLLARRVAEAVRAGSLSTAQAEAVSAAAEGRLLDTAEHSSLTELRDTCLRAKAASDPDRDETYRRIHEKRSLREYTDGEGA